MIGFVLKIIIITLIAVRNRRNIDDNGDIYFLLNSYYVPLYPH